MGVRLSGVTISVAAAAACAVAWRRLEGASRTGAAGRRNGQPETVEDGAAAEATPRDPLLDEIHRALSELSRPELFALARRRGLRPEELFDLTAEELAGEIDRVSRAGR